MSEDRAPPPFRRVGIVGLGLMGGSLARALNRLPEPPEITASSERSDDLEQALEEGVIRRAADAADAVRDADLVVYATPVGVTVELLAEHRGRWPPDAVVMDLGSVKRAVVERAQAIGAGARFVGTHPMAGHHGSGFAAGREHLFRDSRVWICSNADDAPIARVAGLWRALGADPVPTDAETHDRLVAWVSQLPQLAASALALALAESDAGPELLGPGGRDTTRLAASAPELWRDILLHNADLARTPLEALRRALDALAAAVEDEDGDRLEALLDAGRRWRDGAG